MWSYNYTNQTNELYHFGVPGMKWGRRKRQLMDQGHGIREAKAMVKAEKRKLSRDAKDYRKHGMTATYKKGTKEATSYTSSKGEKFSADYGKAVKRKATGQRVAKGVLIGLGTVAAVSVVATAGTVSTVKRLMG